MNRRPGAGRRVACVAIALAMVTLVAAGCSEDAEVSEARTATSPAPSAVPAPPEWAQVPTVAAALEGPDGAFVEWCLLLAATAQHRARGLMDAPDADLGGFDGMVFTWDEDTTGAFHMLDTEVGLSIGFFAADGTFVSARDMDPCPPGTERCPVYGAAGPYRYAVEVPMGDLDDLGVGPGWSLELTGEACAAR